MKKIILLIAMLTSFNAFSQSNGKSTEDVLPKTTSSTKKKNRISVSMGTYKSDFYSKLFLWDHMCDEGCYTTEEKAANFFDINFLYQISIGKNFFIPLGLGFNKKGFSEKGMVNDGGNTWFEYSSLIDRGYLGFLCGMSYDINFGKIFTINIAQFIKPELFNGETNVTPISSRTNLSFQFKAYKNISLQATPFFETAITPYIKNKLFNGEYSYWRPFGYGVDFGISW